MHDEVLQQSRVRENLTYGIDGGFLDKPSEAWNLPYIIVYRNAFVPMRRFAFWR